MIQRNYSNMGDYTLSVCENLQIGNQIYSMLLTSDDEHLTERIKAGQFINISIDGLYLRRPISVCDIVEGKLRIVYKVVGRGTSILSEKKEGDCLKALLPLGNGFNIDENIISSFGSQSLPVLIGGGIGAPPMLLLCKNLIKKGIKPHVILGFNSKSDLILTDDFEDMGITPSVATVDGSFGTKGFVTHCLWQLSQNTSKDIYVFACGPEPMLRNIWTDFPRGQFSFESRMGCGFGACMGCTCMTKTGGKRICKEGPIMFGDDFPMNT